MRRLKHDLLAPFFSDVVAFTILVVSVATVLSVAAMNGEVHQATLRYSVSSSGLTSL